MEMIDQKRRYLWVEVTAIFIIGFLLLALTPLGWGINWPFEYWIRQVLFIAILIAAYLTNSFYLTPKFLLNNKYKEYGFIVIVLVVIIQIGVRGIEHALDLPRLMHEAFSPNIPYVPGPWFRVSVNSLLMTMMAFGVSTTIVLLRKDQRDQLVRQELEKEKVSAELSFLKAQINPHFFFNTLNNIYALTAINVENAREAIHKLSAMMRYVLYDAHNELTMVSQEIKFIENYIELMRLRLPEKVNVDFKKPKNASNELIAPMLLLPYIENAFKHGVSTQVQSSLLINIDITENCLEMQVQNKVFDTNSLKLEGSGIGLANTKRRLDLLYPNNHKVEINETDGHYFVNFQVHLK